MKRFESDCPLQIFEDLQKNHMGINKKNVDTVGLKWSVVRKTKGHAQIRFRVHGRQVALSTGHDNPNALSRTKQAALIREWLNAHPVESKGAAAFDTEVARFIRLQYEGKAPSTVKEVAWALQKFKDALGVVSVQEITKKLCEARKARLQEGLTPKTYKNVLTVARKFLRWQFNEGHITADPLVNFKNPARKSFGRRLAIWDDERFKKTLEYLKGEDREYLQVVYETGIDPADFFQLRPSHIVEARRLTDGSKFWKLYKQRAKAKSSDEVIDQPLSTGARKVILPMLANWWDLSRYKGEMSFASNMLKRVKAAQVKAGYSDPLDVKSLRHTFATRHARRYMAGEGGPPMEELRRWMGHAPDSRVLERLYVHARSSGLYMD